MKFGRIALAAALIFAGTQLHAASPPGVSVDAPAPAFTLTDSEGKTHSLADFRGKFVVLEWVKHYPAHGNQ